MAFALLTPWWSPVVSLQDSCQSLSGLAVGGSIEIVRGYPSIDAWSLVRLWRSVVALRPAVIGTAKRAAEKATAPLGLGIVVVGLGPAGTTVTGSRPPRDFILAARRNAGK